MDPTVRYLLAKERMSELQAEASAERLASEIRRKARTARGARRHGWIAPLKAVLRSLQIRPGARSHSTRPT